MGRKSYYCIIDSETTIKGTIADFGAVVVDRRGAVVDSLAGMVSGHFGVFPLFFSEAAAGWGKAAAVEREAMYNAMLCDGRRSMISVAGVNRWIVAAAAKYGAELTAYNLAFDVGTCGATGIDLSPFPSRFCLWQAAAYNIAQRKAYRQFCLDNHLFGNRTKTGALTYQTKAETVASFLGGAMISEPHTAIEDCLIERDILTALLKIRGWRQNVKPYNYRNFQARDGFAAKCEAMP